MLESHYYKDMIEAGCDEAGRGCLAGSVYAAAVILPPYYQNADLNDSKKLTECQFSGDASCLGPVEGAPGGCHCGWQPFQALPGFTLYYYSKR